MKRDLTELEKDALREVGNIGVSQAANSLSEMINKKVEISVPELAFSDSSEIKHMLDGDEDIVGLKIRMDGDLTGDLFLSFSRKEAVSLANVLLMKDPYENQVLDEMGRSALAEVGNILCSHFSSSLADFLELNLKTLVPDFLEGDPSTVIDELIDNGPSMSNYSLIFNTKFMARDFELNGHFFLLAEPESMDILIEILGKKICIFSE